MNLGHLWKRVYAQLHSVARSTALLLISSYRIVLAPVLGGACRFEPSCSVYAEQVFSIYSFPKAFYLTTKRLLSCQPFGRFGYDPAIQAAECCRGHHARK